MELEVHHANIQYLIQKTLSCALVASLLWPAADKSLRFKRSFITTNSGPSMAHWVCKSTHSFLAFFLLTAHSMRAFTCSLLRLGFPSVLLLVTLHTSRFRMKYKLVHCKEGCVCQIGFASPAGSTVPHDFILRYRKQHIIWSHTRQRFQHSNCMHMITTSTVLLASERWDDCGQTTWTKQGWTKQGCICTLFELWCQPFCWWVSQMCQGSYLGSLLHSFHIEHT